jgi:16S rRNA (adenine1518-N6/adenine1519-N6)-dimethyltransferase
MAISRGIPLQKKYGQHFLRDQQVVDEIIAAAHIKEHSSVFEVGCGEGFLTKAILAQAIDRLWVCEIDQQWASFVTKHIADSRLTIFNEDILSFDFSTLTPHAPWIFVGNLPYNITWPILHKVQQHRELFTNGVIMVQEEVAQKIVQTQGRGYGYSSLFFQHHFDWQPLSRVEPSSFYPQPKIYSRLLHFTPRVAEPIEHEEKFWNFIKICFKQPRRTLKNNLMQGDYPMHLVPESIAQLRAQQMSKQQLLEVWHLLQSHVKKTA